MRVQVAPGKWEDLGPTRVVLRTKPTGYLVPQSPLSTIETDEQRAVKQTTGTRKHYGVRTWRKIRKVEG